MIRRIAFIILVSALLLAPLANAGTCYTKCWTDYFGTVHCTTTCD